MDVSKLENEVMEYAATLDRDMQLDLDETYSRIDRCGLRVLFHTLDEGLGRRARPFGNRLYSGIYTLLYKLACQANSHAAELYQRHNEAHQRYLRETVQPALASKSGEVLVREFVRRWNDHKVMTRWMYNFFMHLDRSYVSNASVPSLISSGLRAFNNLVFHSVRDHLRGTMLNLINSERDGNTVDWEVVRDAAQVMEWMGVAAVSDRLGSMSELTSKERTAEHLIFYHDYFETFFLDGTRDFFRRKASEWFEAKSTPEYMAAVETLLQQEEERINRCLNRRTFPSVLTILQEELLIKNQEALLHKPGSGVSALLKSSRFEDLGRIYRLYHAIDGALGPVADSFRMHVESEGAAIIASRQARIKELADAQKKEQPFDPDFVEEAVTLSRKYMHVVRDQFNNDASFQLAYQKGMETVMQTNTGKNENAVLLANYVDRALRGKLRAKLDAAQVDQCVDDAIMLFEFLRDKDTFGEEYRSLLSRRLLDGKSTSMDAEEAFIAKMKIKCGAQFTSRMDGMVNDLKLGVDANKEFQERWRSSLARVAEAEGLEFGVQVLSCGFWPSFRSLEANLPPIMSAAANVYRSYYLDAHQNRKLKWVLTQGSAEVRARLGKPHVLVVGTMQAVALCMFNAVEDGSELDFEHIRAQMNVQEDVAKKVLHSLACGRFPVLLKVPGGRAVASTDKFKVNIKFKNPKNRFILPMASLEESTTSARVQEDRSFAIDAAIVRIMKARKRMAHNALEAEVHKQLRFFHPTPKQIKRRIEGLIEREYLERDAEDPKMFRYLA